MHAPVHAYELLLLTLEEHGPFHCLYWRQYYSATITHHIYCGTQLWLLLFGSVSRKFLKPVVCLNSS